MAATTAEARQIQIQISSRAPTPIQQGGIISAPMDAPSALDDGVSVLDGTSRSCVKTVLVAILDTATAVDLIVWGYIADVGWVTLEGGARSLTARWADTVSSGALTRIYLQVTATDGGLALFVAPCGVDA